MRLSCYWSWISSWHCQSSCGPSGSADYFDNVMTKFIFNNRTDALKTDNNLFFTITNCWISRSLTRRTNFKFMCLSAYWQYKLANERANFCSYREIFIVWAGEMAYLSSSRTGLSWLKPRPGLSFCVTNNATCADFPLYALYHCLSGDPLLTNTSNLLRTWLALVIALITKDLSWIWYVFEIKL